MTKKRIGKGLDALIPMDLENEILNDKKEQNAEPLKSGATEISVDCILPGENQARQIFADDKLKELTASVAEHGVLQPLLVRKNGDVYELVAGERRLRAAMAANLEKVPVIISDVDDRKAAAMGLIENIQRENLNAMEEAAAYHDMMHDFGYTQEALSQALGKSRSYIANTVRLLTLDEAAKKELMAGNISAGHGRALLSVKAETRREQLLKRIIKEQLSVRQAEEAAKALNQIRPEKKIKPRQPQNEFYVHMENKLRDRFQTKIKITGGENGGRIELSYYNGEELERLLDMMIENE